MSYVSFEGLGASPAATEKVKSLYKFVQQNRSFVNKFIKAWLDQDRGVPLLPGYEKGVKKGGSKATKIGTKTYSLSDVYNTMDASKDAKRTAALMLLFRRDAVHCAKVAAMVIAGLAGLGEFSFSQAWPVLKDIGTWVVQNWGGLLDVFDSLFKNIVPWATSLVPASVTPAKVTPSVSVTPTPATRILYPTFPSAPAPASAPAAPPYFMYGALAAVGIGAFLLLRKK